ncbi:MAG: putative D-aminoacylase [Promethearchaeota archaeon]|nr:MAG: putative D-aminoacylase [Candidatus Lokiarchaeota archaeon]
MKYLIKNGFVIDGTGLEGYKGDVLIEENEIVKMGTEITDSDAKIIEADDLVVCPGFINMHNHGDLNIYEENEGLPYIHQGLTTIVVGMCGIGVAPANDRVKNYYYNFASKAFCSTPMLYDDYQTLFKDLEEKGVGLNLAFFIPQGNIRAMVMGTEEGEPNDQQLEEMKRIVEDNMKAGAFGMSTGLVYPPGSESSTEELIEIAKIVGKYNGIYDSHMRNEGAGLIDIGMKELIRIAQEANVKTHISHWSVISSYNLEEMTEKAINCMKQARSEGLRISADTTVYEDGFTSLSFVLLPTWVFQDFEHNLSDPSIRKRIQKEVFEKLYSMFVADGPFYIKIIPKFILRKLIFSKMSKNVIVLNALKSQDVVGKTIYEVLSTRYPSRSLEDAILDFIKDEEGGIMIRIVTKDEETGIIPLFSQQYVAPSSDGIPMTEGNTHPRTYNAFPRVIARWVREKSYLRLEEAVRKMTSLPASILGLDRRGSLKEGNKADIVVFDYDIIQDRGSLEDGKQYPEGIEYVFVNGELIINHGEFTGKCAGTVLRHTY